MGRKKNAQPTYLHHKPSGQARVRIDGVDVYLGVYGSQESRQKYYQLLAERFGDVRPARALRKTSANLTVGEFLEAYREFASGYYGEKSKELNRVACAVRPIRELFGLEPAAEFSPLKLQTVLDRLVLNGDTRKEVVAAGYRTISRTTVNDYLAVIKRVFKWGVSQELIANGVYQALLTVEGVRRGRGKLAAKTHGPKKILPVPPKDFDAVVKDGGLTEEVKTMIQVQLLTGMRPDEVTIMRPGDIDQTVKPCWVYRPGKHKNDWRDGMADKEVLIGPKAQKLLRPWLDACKRDTDYLFSPRAVAKKWNEEQLRTNGKKTAFAKLNALRPPRECYDDHSYRQAVRRACKRAGVDYWSPGRLRHNTGTFIRSEFGAEAAKTVLGHRHLSTTEIYAEKDRAKYASIMKQLG